MRSSAFLALALVALVPVGVWLLGAFGRFGRWAHMFALPRDQLVQTSEGPVVGEGGVPGSSCASFYGIPYAAPPTGANRFRPPQPSIPWAAPRSAKRVGASCLQVEGSWLPPWLQFLAQLLRVGSPGISEDCLFLNVWTPRPNDASAGLPVMVWIHGGSYLSGSGDYSEGVPWYDGHTLCREGDVVIVSMNYRLGVFGFYTSQELLEEQGTAGNMGIQDQRAALQWVQRNARAFGGDPARVTIFGESSGANAVVTHLTFPRSASLFSAAIVQSGGLWGQPFATMARRSAELAVAAGCGAGAALACMRSRSAEELLAVQVSSQAWSGAYSSTDGWQEPEPVADGYELPMGSSSRDVLRLGLFAAKPVIVGTNRNESELFYCPRPWSRFGRADMRAHLASDILSFMHKWASQQQLDLLMGIYDASRYGGLWQRAYVDTSTDINYSCDSRDILDAVKRKGQPAFQYVLGGSTWFFHMDPCLGTPHSTDIFLLWRSFAVLSPSGSALGRRMSRYWTSFAWQRHPGAPWPEYGQDRSYLRIDTGEDTPGVQWKSPQCDVFAAIRYSEPHSGADRNDTAVVV